VFNPGTNPIMQVGLARVSKSGLERSFRSAKEAENVSMGVSKDFHRELLIDLYQVSRQRDFRELRTITS
jgi:hypothetical protein